MMPSISVPMQKASAILIASETWSVRHVIYIRYGIPNPRTLDTTIAQTMAWGTAVAALDASSLM
jgi:hypothetical protein